MALSQGSLTDDAVLFHIYSPPCLSYLTHPPSALPAVGTWTPYTKVITLNSRVRPKLYPENIPADPSCWLWVSSWPEVRGCPQRMESDILPQKEIPLELLCLPASFHLFEPGSSGPSECFSASPHHALVDVHLSHTALPSCHVVFHLHILALIWESFSTHPPSPSCIFPAPTTPDSPAHSSPRSPRNRPENTGREHQQTKCSHE